MNIIWNDFFQSPIFSNEQKNRISNRFSRGGTKFDNKMWLLKYLLLFSYIVMFVWKANFKSLNSCKSKALNVPFKKASEGRERETFHNSHRQQRGLSSAFITQKFYHVVILCDCPMGSWFHHKAIEIVDSIHYVSLNIIICEGSH